MSVTESAITARNSGGVAVAESELMLTDPTGVNHLTDRIIGAAIRVHRELGPGLLESVYAACLVMEIRAVGLRTDSELGVPIVYNGVRLDVGLRIDLLVEDRVIVEVKAVEVLAPIHRAQVLTYLKLRRCPVGLLLNFNVPVLKDGIVRVVNGSFLRKHRDLGK
jgi:GxxExxY protein